MSIYKWQHHLVKEDIQYIWCDTPDVIGSPNEPTYNGLYFEPNGETYILSPAIILNTPPSCVESLEARPMENK